MKVTTIILVSHWKIRVTIRVKTEMSQMTNDFGRTII